MAKTFFKKPDAPSGGSSKAGDQGEFITWGAAWMGELRGSDLPYLSVRVSKEELVRMIEYAEQSDKGDISFMMFPNRNPRPGKSDPDYYLFPPKDKE
jgi:hypothetical protein